MTIKSACASDALRSEFASSFSEHKREAGEDWVDDDLRCRREAPDDRGSDGAVPKRRVCGLRVGEYSSLDWDADTGRDVLGVERRVEDCHRHLVPGVIRGAVCSRVIIFTY